MRHLQSHISLRVARLPSLRALAWAEDVLYASRGYELLILRMGDLSDELSSGNFRSGHPAWQSVAKFSPSWPRRLSSASRLAARLFRDGFHALAPLPSGGFVAAVPGAIVTLRPGESEFRVTYPIARGTRPLHITVVPDGTVYWGEYFDNAVRDEVHIYASSDAGITWSIAYTFPKGAVRHVHNIVHDAYENCLWVLTGDYGNECRILRAWCDLSRVEPVLQGNQQARAVAAVPMPDGLYFSSDTPLEQNYIYRIDRSGSLSRLAPISSSSIYGCRVGEHVFFSTMVEPSEVNRDRSVRVYGARCAGVAEAPAPLIENDWQPLLSWKKDRWPLKFFQYGNAFLPDGNNSTPYLAVSTVAVDSDDMATSLYSVNESDMP